MAKPLILIVDDDKDVADEMRLTISDSKKYDVVTAYSAKEAIQVLKKNRKLLSEQKNKVRCIVLDIKMPEMDGLQFLENIRKEYNEDQIGVIMMTAYEDADKWERATQGIVAAYLKKPYREDELIKTLDRFFSGEQEKIKMEMETFEKHIERRKKFGG
jgi:CheY-like chemotaxis protein